MKYRFDEANLISHVKEVRFLNHKIVMMYSACLKYTLLTSILRYLFLVGCQQQKGKKQATPGFNLSFRVTMLVHFFPSCIARLIYAAHVDANQTECILSHMHHTVFSDNSSRKQLQLLHLVSCFFCSLW